MIHHPWSGSSSRSAQAREAPLLAVVCAVEIARASRSPPSYFKVHGDDDDDDDDDGNSNPSTA